MPEILAVDRLYARGHPNIKALHRTTLEITKDDYVTPRGDCIIAVGASKAASELCDELKRAIRSGGYVTLILILRPHNLVEVVRGVGAPTLTLEDPRSIVVRKSSFTDTRTIAIRSDKAAVDLDRSFVERLKDSNSSLEVLIVAHSAPVAPSQLARTVRELARVALNQG
uniref:DUF371 domain-containing protein n=1 Tax=Thermofilum pendens TaxID=2269 RepID=A0A7C1NYD9_THEPE